MVRSEDSLGWARERWFGGITSEQVPACVAAVDFTWEYYGREIPMRFATGILGVDLVDGFYTPKIGFAVLERETGRGSGRGGMLGPEGT